jgi:hypothetical protein
MKYVIQKPNGKKLSSIYLNDLGYTDKYAGINNKDADHFGFIKKPAPNKLFVFRENSCMLFDSMEQINNEIESYINDIKKDDRYNEKIKNSLIKSANNLRKNITEA